MLIYVRMVLIDTFTCELTLVNYQLNILTLELGTVYSTWHSIIAFYLRVGLPF